MDNVGVATIVLCNDTHRLTFMQIQSPAKNLLSSPTVPPPVQSSINQSEAELRGQWPIRGLQCNNNEKLLRFCTCCAIKCADNEFFLINLETVMNQYVLSLKIN